MSPRSARNLVLLILIVALALVAHFRPGKPKGLPAVTLLDIETSGIDRIELLRPDAILFQRKAGTWLLTAPLEAPANPLRIEQLLDITKTKSEAQYPMKDLKLAPFGLDKPLAILKLNDQVMTFGGTDPLSFRRYVVVGDTLHLVSDGFSHHLTAQATDYVQKKLVADELSIKSLTLPGLKIEKTTDGGLLVTPPRSSLDAKDLLSAWQSARAIEVQRGDPKMMGETIRLELSNGAPTEFVIVQKSPELVLLRKDLGLTFLMTPETSKELLGDSSPSKEGREESVDTDNNARDPSAESPLDD
ncbi:MAG: DUF4340 domain-containing protein [Methylococcus sp.]